MKRVTYFIIFLIVLFITSHLIRSNTVYVRMAGYDSGGTTAMKKLSELVDANYLDREWYEVETISNNGPCFFVNYNKEYQTLLISNDPLSGWSYHFRCTPMQLKKVTDREIPVNELEKELVYISTQEHRHFPTRSMDIFSIF